MSIALEVAFVLAGRVLADSGVLRGRREGAGE